MKDTMHRIFGIKEDVEYIDREGVYFIPCRNNQVGVVHTPKGYFLLGGGLELKENYIECLERECLEEVGCFPRVEGKLCSSESYMMHPTIGYFHPIQTYYYGTLCEKKIVPEEAGHILCWIEYDKIKGKLFVEMQNWALEQLAEYMQ